MTKRLFLWLLLPTACLGMNSPRDAVLELGPRNRHDIFVYRLLQCAVVNGHGALVQCCLERGVDVDKEELLLDNAGHLTVDVVRLFLEYGLTVTNGELLSRVLQHGNTDVARLLLEYDKNIDVHYCHPFCDWVGGDVLWRAVPIGDVDLVRTLLQRGARHDERNSGISLLHLAASHGMTAIAQVLIEYGADVNAVCCGSDTPGETPLYYAVSSFKSSIVQLLLQHGADCTVRNASGETVLDVFEEYMGDFVSNARMDASNVEEVLAKIGVKYAEIWQIRTLLQEYGAVRTKK